MLLGLWFRPLRRSGTAGPRTPGGPSVALHRDPALGGGSEDLTSPGWTKGAPEGRKDQGMRRSRESQGTFVASEAPFVAMPSATKKIEKKEERVEIEITRGEGWERCLS